MRQGILAIAMAFVVLAAGCIGATDDEETEQASVSDELPANATGHALEFSAPSLIDDTRAGGEPVIAVTQEGTILVSAHPGWTHVHPSEDPTNPPTELVRPASGESYIWRSTDGGESWQHVGLPNADGEGPRGAAFGVSDPDFTIDGDGRIYYTDLYLFEASVGWSDDDGETWVMGNPIASQGVVDRQWLASNDGKVYFTANYFAPTPGRHVVASEDGVVWEQVGDIPQDCGADFVGSPHDSQTLYAGCGGGVAVSTDAGASWEQRMVPGHEEAFSRMTEPAVDGAGNVWTAWETDESELYLAGSPDQGETWPWVHEVSDEIGHAFGNASDHTVIWPWVSAGSQGRVALSVFASPTAPPSDGGPSDRSWSLVTVSAFGADSQQPETHAYELAADIHEGPVCQSGTFCQVNSLQGDENSDRRLGDFFETTIGPDGNLYATFSNTTAAPDDVVSHPSFVVQTGGPSFVAEGSDFVPTQG